MVELWLNLFGTAWLTFVLELPVMLLAYGEKSGMKYTMKITLLVNLITNIAMNTVLALFFPFDLALVVLPFEFLVFVAELFLYKKAFGGTFKKAALVSLIANVVSLVLGFLLMLVCGEVAYYLF